MSPFRARATRTDPLESSAEDARLEVLRRLAEAGYAFTPPAPSVVARVRLKRGLRSARTLEDIFGWNMPFRMNGAFADWVPLLTNACMVRPFGPRWVTTLRVADIAGNLFLHGAFPARSRDSVFLGPDSVRFAQWIVSCMPDLPNPRRIIDIGAGSGVGGIVAASHSKGTELVLLDINAEALRLARVNALVAGLTPQTAVSDGLGRWGYEADMILANPPYLGGGPSHIYSDGGGVMGAGLTLTWTHQALEALSLGGSFVLYSGAPVTRDGDTLRPALERLAQAQGARLVYAELEPDVFPSTLLHRPYWGVERIAAIGAVMTRPRA